MENVTNHNSDIQSRTHSHSESRHQHRSHSSRHRKKRGFWHRFARLFRRKKDRISGVKKNQQIEEIRVMVIFTLIAIGLLCILIPLITGFFEYF